MASPFSLQEFSEKKRLVFIPEKFGCNDVTANNIGSGFIVIRIKGLPLSKGGVEYNAIYLASHHKRVPSLSGPPSS